jgi:hypothetical protein
MLLGNWYSTFRDNQVVSYSSVDNIKNISLHEDVFASLFLNVDNKISRDTASHVNGKDTECSWSHPGWNWRFLRQWMTHKEQKLSVTVRHHYRVVQICRVTIFSAFTIIKISNASHHNIQKRQIIQYNPCPHLPRTVHSHSIWPPSCGRLRSYCWCLCWRLRTMSCWAGLLGTR